jgi:hypothetical protein
MYYTVSGCENYATQFEHIKFYLIVAYTVSVQDLYLYSHINDYNAYLNLTKVQILILHSLHPFYIISDYQWVERSNRI